MITRLLSLFLFLPDSPAPARNSRTAVAGPSSYSLSPNPSPPSPPLSDSSSSSSSPSSPSQSPNIASPDPVPTYNKDLIHFVNINGIIGKKGEIKYSLSGCPQAAMLAMVEAKLAPDQPIPKVYGYNSVAFEHTHASSGILCYSALSTQIVKKLKFNKEGSMMLFMNVTLLGGLRVAWEWFTCVLKSVLRCSIKR